MDHKLYIPERPATAWSPEAALRLVKLPVLMDITAGVPDVAIALVDGPIALDHPELTLQNIRPLNQSKCYTCAKPESFACTHGTHVGGLLFAKRDGPVPGICPGCSLVVRSIFSEAADVPPNAGVPNATVSELAAALLEVIEIGARVINLSAGVTEAALRTERALNHALDLASRRGVIVIAAAGNQGTLGSSVITPPSVGDSGRRLRSPQEASQGIESRRLNRPLRPRCTRRRNHESRSFRWPCQVQRQQRRRTLRHWDCRTSIVNVSPCKPGQNPLGCHRKRGP